MLLPAMALLLRSSRSLAIRASCRSFCRACDSMNVAIMFTKAAMSHWFGTGGGGGGGTCCGGSWLCTRVSPPSNLSAMNSARRRLCDRARSRFRSYSRSCDVDRVSGMARVHTDPKLTKSPKPSVLSCCTVSNNAECRCGVVTTDSHHACQHLK